MKSSLRSQLWPSFTNGTISIDRKRVKKSNMVQSKDNLKLKQDSYAI